MGIGKSYQKSNNFFSGLFFVNTGAIRTLAQQARTMANTVFHWLGGVRMPPSP